MTTKQSLPKKLKVGLYEWRVRLVPDEQWVDKGSYGVCERASRLVLIRDNDEWWDTFLHELFHVLWSEWVEEESIRSATKHDPDFDFEEAIVEAYSRGFMVFLRDNPGVVPFLQIPK